MSNFNSPAITHTRDRNDDEVFPPSPAYEFPPSQTASSPARSDSDDINRAILEALHTIRHVDRDMAALTAEVKRLAAQRTSEETSEDIYRKSLDDYITNRNKTTESRFPKLNF
jgi:uncharacterized small protein (DUF1192 family)